MKKFSKAARLASAAFAFCAGTSLSTLAHAQGGTTAASQDAAADQAPTDQNPDIIVTAAKRATSLQSTPLAVTALTGETLEDRNIVNVQSLAQTVPSMQIGANASNARVAIRGIGLDSFSPGAEGRVAYHVDGVYYARPKTIFGTFFDVSRIEVVRGPQGTLYGRNSTGGAINVITNDPDMDGLSGYLRLGLGNYQTVTTDAAVSVPLSDTFAARLAVQTIDQNKGFGRNTYLNEDVNDKHTRAARLKLKWQPNSDLSITFLADHSNADDANFTSNYGGPGIFQGTGPFTPLVPLGIALGGTVPNDRRDVRNNTPTINKLRAQGLSAVLEWNLGFGTLTSITGYRRHRSLLSVDQDITQVEASALNVFDKGHQFTQEIRLAGKVDRLNWLVGGFLFRDYVRGYFVQSPFHNLYFPGSRPGKPPFLAFGTYSGGEQHTDSESVFGQVGYEIVPSLTVNVGGRLEYERRDADQFSVNLTNVQIPGHLGLDPPWGVPFFPKGVLTCPVAQPRVGEGAACVGKSSANSFTPRVNVEFQATPDIYVFATWAKGNRSGAFPVGSLNDVLKPEKITDYEVGFKARLLDRTLTFNGTAFLYDYSNIQLTQRTTSGVISVTGPAASVKGLEAEIVWLLGEHVRLDFTGSILDAKYKSFLTTDPSFPGLGIRQLKGNRMLQAPRYTANVGGEYSWDQFSGRLTARAEGLFMGRTDFAVANHKFVAQMPYFKFNAYLNYVSDNRDWEFQLWGKNLTDKLTVANTAASNAGNGGPLLPTYEPPRTFGVSVTRNF